MTSIKPFLSIQSYGVALYAFQLLFVLLSSSNMVWQGLSPNKEFKIIKPGIATLEYFRIFNRWENLVFERSDINKGLRLQV